jgi:alcohol dehydrogenase
MAQKAAWSKGAGRVIGVDILPYRMEMAQKACRSEVINAKEIDPVHAVMEMTQGHGADVCIDAVGMEADTNLFESALNMARLQAGSIKVFDNVLSSVRRGGRISVLGVYGTTYNNFPLGQWLDKGVQIWAGQAPVHNYIDELMEKVETGELRTDDIITHSLSLDQVSDGYKIFNKKEDNCVKVVLKP